MCVCVSVRVSVSACVCVRPKLDARTRCHKLVGANKVSEEGVIVAVKEAAEVGDHA